MAKRIGDVICEAMNAENIKYFYGYIGGAGGPMMYDPLYDHPEIITVQVRHESSAPFMAMATTRLTGNPAVCHGTTGPGLINLVPGMAEAYAACAPVLAVVPSTDRRVEDRRVIHEINSVPVFAPITKWSVRVDVPEKLPWIFQRACSIACNGRPGPVYIEIPSDLFAPREYPEYIPSIRPIRIRADPSQISAAAEVILKSERPIVVCGGGALSSAAYTEVKEFAELLGMPVFTTPTGRGIIPEDHPLAAGQIGIYRDEKLASKWFEESDLVISIGCRWESLESGRWWWFPPKAKFIQIDIDFDEIGRSWWPNVAVVGDAKMVLRDLIDALIQKVEKKKLDDMPRVKELVEAKKVREAEIDAELSNKTNITSLAVVRELNKVFGKDTILSCENAALDLASYYFPYYKVLDAEPQVGIWDSMNIMGGGICAAIAAKIVKPDKKVVCTAGDGAFQMYMHEVVTSVQYNAPITVVIMNNRCIGWSKYSQIAHFDRVKDADFEVSYDFVKFAEASKCYGERVEKANELRGAMENALKANKEGKTAILDVIFPEKWWEDQPEAWLKWNALSGWGIVERARVPVS